MTRKARIAHLAGPNATIQNTPPLVTSNKARVKHGLSLLTNPDGSPVRFDVLRPQRLAAPVTAYVEQFSGIRLKPTPLSSTARQTVTSTTPDACTRSAKAPTTSRFMRSSCVLRTGCILSRTCRRRQTAAPGRRSARSPALQRLRHGKGSSQTARAASRRSTGCRSARRALET